MKFFFSAWPAQSKTALVTAVVFLGATCLFLLFWRGFTEPDEGRYAEIPREMNETGNWLEMRLLGYRYYEKPPMAYWIVAPSIKIFGAHDWAARIPLLPAALALFALFWRRLKRFWPAKTAAVSFMLSLSTVGVISSACLLLTDAFLAAFFAATSLWLFDAFLPDTPPRKRLLLTIAAALAAAAGFLTKGAVAIILPAGILLLWLLWEKRTKAILSWAIPAAIAAAILILAPTLSLIERHNPDFFHKFIIEEHLARFQGTRAQQGHEEPFYFFGPIILLLMLPWTGFIFLALRRAWLQRKQKPDPFSRYIIVWTVVVVGFFSISSGKLMSYIMPAFFPLGLLLGRWGLSETPGANQTLDRRLWFVGIGVMWLICAAICGVWALAYFQTLPNDIYPITGISVIALAPPLAGVFMAWLFGRFRKFHSAMLMAAGMFLGTAIMFSPLAGKDFNVFMQIGSSISYKSLAAALKPGDRVIVFWAYRPALPFYTKQLYIPFQDENEMRFGMSLEQPNRGNIKDLNELALRTRDVKGRIYALVEPENFEEKFLRLNLPFSRTSLPCDPNTIILEIFPQRWNPKPEAL